MVGLCLCIKVVLCLPWLEEVGWKSFGGVNMT